VSNIFSKNLAKQLEFSRKILLEPSVKHFTEIHPVGGGLCHADTWTRSDTDTWRN